MIIPTYNRTGLLKEAIDSVLSQKSVDFMWEVIVIDNTPLDEDGSTPALRIIEKQNDSRILYFHNEENIGSGYNWNRGVEKARGTWVSFLHDDDILYPDALRNIRRILMQRKIVQNQLDIYRRVLMSLRMEKKQSENPAIRESISWS